MILQQTDNYIRVCMNAWLLCEASIYTEERKLFPRESLLNICQACSESCFSIVSIFASNSQVQQQPVLDCFLYCRECFNECMMHEDKEIQYCCVVCDRCAEAVKELLLFHVN